MEFVKRKKWIESNLTHWEPLFQEQRQFILLDKGFHYHQTNSRSRKAIEQNPNLTEKAKIRITKNHLNYVGREIMNKMLDRAPGVGIFPQNEAEIQDQKTAELNRAVWADIVDRHELRSRFNEFSYPYTVPGEICVFTSWNPNKGRYLGLDQHYDANGKPVGKPEVAFSGDFVFEVVDGYNLVLDQNARRFDESDAAFRKFIDRSELEQLYGDDPVKLDYIKKSCGDVYTAFDSTTGTYDRDTSGKALVWYHFVRQSKAYPLGHFWISTAHGDLEEEDIPGGVWPLTYENYESSGDSCRGNGPYRHLRTFQMNLNRLASKAVENSVVMSADKFVTQKGSTVRAAPTQAGHGTAIFEYMGVEPKYYPGSAGEQFIAQSAAELSEMYNFAGLDDQDIDKMPTEAMATLFRNVAQKAKFSRPVTKYEMFLVRLCRSALEMARMFYPDDMLAAAVGGHEIVNLPEFRSMEPLRYRITVQPQTDDANTVMGKTIQINQLLQYAGPHMDKEMVGVLARSMPFMNKEPFLKEFTLNYDAANNIILALNRGEWPEIYERDDNEFIIPRLIARTREADFSVLNPFFQMMFHKQIEMREQAEQRKQQLTAMANQGAIPTSGEVVRVNMYQPGPDGMPHRIWLPAASVKWLQDKLEQQGIAQDLLSRMDSSTVANFGKANMDMQQALPPMTMGD